MAALADLRFRSIGVLFLIGWNAVLGAEILRRTILGMVKPKWVGYLIAGGAAVTAVMLFRLAGGHQVRGQRLRELGYPFLAESDDDFLKEYRWITCPEEFFVYMHYATDEDLDDYVLVWQEPEDEGGLWKILVHVDDWFDIEELIEDYYYDLGMEHVEMLDDRDLIEGSPESLESEEGYPKDWKSKSFRELGRRGGPGVGRAWTAAALGRGDRKGACYMPDGTCFEATQFNCLSRGFYYAGDGVPCFGGTTPFDKPPQPPPRVTAKN